MDYKKMIIDIVEKIDRYWLLEQIYYFVVNMTTEGD